MNWLEIPTVKLQLRALSTPVTNGLPLEAHKAWINSGGAVERVDGILTGHVLVVHRSLQYIAVKHFEYRHKWSKVDSDSTPYETFVTFNWARDNARYVRVVTPTIAWDDV